MAGIVEATRAYEAWAGKRIDLVAGDVRRKHRAMAAAPFPFLRATFYRWAALWPEICPELATTPRLLAVGDLHVENFGTWRDAEGRLAWGINDFDEACPMPYAIDLVRLATSVLIAIREDRLTIGADAACAALLAGYGETIGSGTGQAFVLEEMHPALRAMATSEERNPDRFWTKLNSIRSAKPPSAVRKLLLRQLPDGAAKPRFGHRSAGLGSLGRPRYVALAECDGGMVAREAKAMLPSAFAWALGERDQRLHYDDILARAIRSPDPFLKTKKGWVLRRLAPHCTAIELADFPGRRDERHILHAMGRETGNVHLGSPAAIAAIRRDLRKRRGAWLRDAALRMTEATLQDWKAWRRSRAG